MTAALHKRIDERLAAIERAGLTRALRKPEGIDLTSNDYLGLAKDNRIREAAIYSIKCDGVGSTGSRLLRGHREKFADAERMFAEWKKTERSLYFSTGYQANLSVISAFVEKDDIVFSDQLNHASLIDGIRLAKAKRVVCTHCDIDFVARELRDYRAKGQKFFITESLFSMDGDIAPLDKYAEICRETRTNLIVDEAHAVGIYGETGSGLIEHFGIEKDVFLSINTAGKALGVSGAFVAGAEWAIEYLIQTARPFIFSTAPPPMTAAAIMAAVNIVRTETERCARLSRLVTFFNELLRFNEIAVTDQEVETQIIPIHIGKNRRATEVAGLLQASGFDVRAIRPPTVPDGTARLRISLNALLTEDKLREFVRCLKNALAQD